VVGCEQLLNQSIIGSSVTLHFLIILYALLQRTTDNGQNVGWALPTTKLINDKLALES